MNHDFVPRAEATNFKGQFAARLNSLVKKSLPQVGEKIRG
jgi:hypothetical protein